MIIKKSLAVAVILLFIGLAFAPSINANISKEMVEFTTEVCGLNGGKQTVKLTQEEAEEVDALFQSIRERLNATESREETEEIFKEAVVELDKYGLLGGLSVEQAQRLVTGGYQNSRVMKLLLSELDRNPMVLDDDENMFCLIAGKTSSTFFESRVTRFCGKILELVSWYAEYGYFLLLLLYLFTPVWIFYGYSMIFDNIKPISTGHRIGLGAYEPMCGSLYPATGWVHTNGLNGIKDWSGSFWGNLSFSYFPSEPWIMTMMTVYQGVHGFRGIKISWKGFYMGSALRVKISPERPDE